MPRGWFRQPTDTFREVLHASSEELESFGWSGWAFNTLDLYLESRHQFMVDHYGDPTATALLSKARGSYWLVLPSSAACELLTALYAVECKTSDLIAFIADEHGPDEAAEEAVAVREALAKLKSWLAEVPPGSVGLLSVG